jgi:glutathione S-transferase
MSSPLVLFGLRRSVYTRVARLALETKAVPYRLEEVEVFGPQGVPAEHIRRHPFGRVPVLAHGSFQLYETHAICRYVDEAFTGIALQPPTPAGRARMAQVVGLLDSYAYRPMVWGVFVQRVRVPLRGGVADEPVVSQAMLEVEKSLDALASLKGSSRFLVGDDLTLADLHGYPMIKYLALSPEGSAALSARPSLASWLQELDLAPSAIATRTEYES